MRDVNSLNKVILVGRLGQKPEARFIPGTERQGRPLHPGHQRAVLQQEHQRGRQQDRMAPHRRLGPAGRVLREVPRPRASRSCSRASSGPAPGRTRTATSARRPKSRPRASSSSASARNRAAKKASPRPAAPDFPMEGDETAHAAAAATTTSHSEAGPPASPRTRPWTPATTSKSPSGNESSRTSAPGGSSGPTPTSSGRRQDHHRRARPVPVPPIPPPAGGVLDRPRPRPRGDRRRPGLVPRPERRDLHPPQGPPPPPGPRPPPRPHHGDLDRRCRRIRHRPGRGRLRPVSPAFAGFRRPPLAPDPRNRVVVPPSHDAMGPPSQLGLIEAALLRLRFRRVPRSA